MKFREIKYNINYTSTKGHNLEQNLTPLPYFSALPYQPVSIFLLGTFQKEGNKLGGISKIRQKIFLKC